MRQSIGESLAPSPSSSHKGRGIRFLFAGRLLKKGLSFMEVVMTILIINVGLAGTASLFSVGFKQVNDAKVKLPASWIAQDLMEEVLAKKWEDPVSPGQALGPEAGESRAGFDDIDDYNGLAEAPPKTIEGLPMDGSHSVGQEPLPNYRNFRRSVSVEYVDQNTLKPPNPPVPVGYTTDYKKVTVEVGYSAAGDFTRPDFTYSLTQIAARHG